VAVIGNETSIATNIKVSKRRLEILADTLKEQSDDTKVVLVCEMNNEETESPIYLKVMKVVFSGLPLFVVSMELKSQTGALFLENVWNVLTLLLRNNEELENDVRHKEAVNQELQQVLEITREGKKAIEETLLKKFMLLLNEKKQKIEQLEQQIIVLEKERNVETR
jgi:hypothetical protein